MAGGKTLVHCIAGVSRSVSLCSAYLMTSFKSETRTSGNGNMGSEEAVKYIQKRRGCANPNSGFMRQLGLFERELAKKSVTNIWNISCEGLEALDSMDNIIKELKSRTPLIL